MPANSNKLTDETKARILELHATGMTRNDIAREIGRSAGSVTNIVTAAGLSFDRTATDAATQARKADLSERRATAQDIELQILEASQTAVLGALKGEIQWKTILRNSDGAETEQAVSFIPAADIQRHANSRSSSTTIITRLTDNDAGVQAVTSLLGALAENLGIDDSTETPADP